MVEGVGRSANDALQHGADMRRAEPSRWTKAYRIRVEAELNKICGEILELIDTNLVPMSTAGESKVFYFKMKGDYFRYIAEFTEGEGKTGAANAAHGAYNQ